MDTATTTVGRATPWNNRKLLGQKPPLKLRPRRSKAHARRSISSASEGALQYT